MNVTVTKQSLLEQAQKAVNIDQLNKLVEEIVDLVVEKNKAYGDSWQLYGPLTALIRIREKLVRLDNVVTSGTGEIYVSVKSCEGASEELNDIIGYALLMKLWLAGNTSDGMLHLDANVDVKKFTAAMHNYVENLPDSLFLNTPVLNLDNVLPKNWFDCHSPDCGHKYRGCAPDCPKDIYERTGEWHPLTDK